MKSQLNRFDTVLTNWVVSTFGTTSRPFFEVITALGDPVSIILITGAIVTAALAQPDYRLAIAGLMIPVTIIVGATLKILFERARPMTDYAMRMKIKTFSFPSGHSSGSAVAFGLLAYIALMKLTGPFVGIAACALAVIPIFVGISRIYLGAHFPSDVLAGWLLGLFAVVFIVTIIHPLT